MSLETNSFSDDSIANAQDIQLNKIVQSLELIIELQNGRDQTSQRHNEMLELRLKNIEKSITKIAGSEAPETDNSWDSQKLSLLAEHGILTDEELLGDPKPKAEPKVVEEPKTVVDTTATIIPTEPAAEPDEIVQLRAQLRQTLREAEIDLGIKQSKLEQQEARIEERMAQLEKLEFELKKTETITETIENSGVLGRLKKHLAVMSNNRKEKEADAKESNAENE